MTDLQLQRVLVADRHADLVAGARRRRVLRRTRRRPVPAAAAAVVGGEVRGPAEVSVRAG